MPLLFSLVFGEGVINDATSVSWAGVWARAECDAAAVSRTSVCTAPGCGVVAASPAVAHHSITPLSVGAAHSPDSLLTFSQVVLPGAIAALNPLFFSSTPRPQVVLLGAIEAMGGGKSGTEKSSGSLGGLAYTFLYLFIASAIMGSASGLGIAFVLKHFKCHGPHQVCGCVQPEWCV